MSDGWRPGAAVIWRGFEHRWLRRVLGFSTPHRISKLASFVDEAPAFNFAQAAGVDGNFMRPVGHYGVVQADDLLSRFETIKLSFSDQVTGDPPMATSEVHQRIKLPDRPSKTASWPVLALLNGFAIRSRCVDAHQPEECPCNSNGFWPVELDFETRLVDDDVEVRVSLHRAWTPMLGGLPPFEIKPLNHRLDYEVEVHVALLCGPTLNEAKPLELRETTSAQRAEAATGASTSAPLGLTRWGFTMPHHTDRGPRKHRGRYLDQLAFWLGQAGETALQAQIHAPRTVVPTAVSLRLDALTSDGCQMEIGSVEGKLCFNSTPQAPWFSRWQGCDCPERGPARAEHRVPLSSK